jgi:cellulose biosynthesis protein BcsQ
MAKIIMFGNQKGGVGKSQCTLLVATALSQSPFNLKVCVIDTDTQKSISRLRNLDLRAYPDTDAPFPVLEMNVSEMQKKLNDLDKQYQVILLDTAGKLDTAAPVESQEITKTIMYVDYLFIPFVAGNFNLQASLDYLKYALSIQRERASKAGATRPLNVVGFVNMFDGRTKKNTILLVDFTNQLREHGKGLEEAIREAGEVRFLPIILTSMTAIGGLMPIALSSNPLISPLAIVLIGGLISSTLLSGIAVEYTTRSTSSTRSALWPTVTSTPAARTVSSVEDSRMSEPDT